MNADSKGSQAKEEDSPARTDQEDEHSDNEQQQEQQQQSDSANSRNNDSDSKQNSSCPNPNGHEPSSSREEKKISAFELCLTQFPDTLRTTMAMELSYKDIAHLALCSRTTLEWYHNHLQSVHYAWRWKQSFMVLEGTRPTVRALDFYFLYMRKGKIGTQALMHILVPLIRADALDCAKRAWDVFLARRQLTAANFNTHLAALAGDISRMLLRLKARREFMTWFISSVRPVLYPTEDSWRERRRNMICEAVHFSALDAYRVLLQDFEQDGNKPHSLVGDVMSWGFSDRCREDDVEAVRLVHSTIGFTIHDLTEDHLLAIGTPPEERVAQYLAATAFDVPRVYVSYSDSLNDYVRRNRCRQKHPTCIHFHRVPSP